MFHRSTLLRQIPIGVSCFFVPLALAQVAVLTNHNDNARTGANLAETTLNVSNVNVNQFGKLFSLPVDASIYAQPLYVPNVNISGKGLHNVVYVATMNDSVYAFDADQNTGPNAAALWSVNFTNPAAGITPVPSADVQPYATDIIGPVGIVSTPVIDSSTNTIYLLARTKENGAYVQRLHALDITSGAEKFGGPVAIQASVSSSTGQAVFDPKTQNQRVGLGLANGLVYLTWASHNDAGTFYGWIMAYSASNLQQTAVFNDTPDGAQGGIWHSGQAPAFDAAGNAYLSTGNGAWDGSRNFGSTVIKLAPALTLSDWFTPDNYVSLNAGDLDLGSSGPMLIPNTSLLFAGGKQGIAYLVNTNSMGHLASGNGKIVQSFLAGNGNIHGGAVYWQSPVLGPLVYIWSEFDYLKAYHFNGTNLDTTPVSQSLMRVPDGMPGGFTAVSSNGAASGTGILWTSTPFNGDANHATVQGIVRAFDASNLTHVLWDTQQNPARDDIGNFAKFVPPTIANGKVYMASFSNALAVYGLLAPNTDFALSTLAPSQAVAPGSSISYTVTVSDLPGSVFGGTVNFSVSGLPANVTAVFNPASLTGDASTTLTVAAASTVSPGSYTLTVTGNSGASNHSVTLTLTINTAAMGVGPGLSADVGSPFPPGSSSYSGGTYTVRGGGTDIWFTSDQFQFDYWQMAGDGTVIARILSPASTNTYAKSGLMIRESLYSNSKYAMMAGMPSLYSFQYNNGSGATAINYPASSYPFWVKVVRSNGNFTGYYSPDGVTWSQVGDSASINMASTAYVGLAVTSHTPGTLGTATFDHVSYQSSSSASPDFTILASPPAESIFAGNVNTYAVSTTASNGFAGAISFSTSGLPPGMTASFNPSIITGTGTTTLTLSTTSGLAAGPYGVTIRASSGALVRDQTVSLSVNNFGLSVNPSSQTVLVGGSTSFSIGETGQNSYSGSASLSISGVPAGVTATFEPAAVDWLVSSTLSIQTTPGMTPGTYSMLISGISGGQVRTIPVTLIVNAVPDFTVAVAPGTQSIFVGSAASYSVSTTAAGGFSGVIALSASGLPSGATAAFSPVSLTGSGSSTLTIQTSGATPAGAYSLVITAASGSLSHTAAVVLNVTFPVFGSGGGTDADVGSPTLAGSASSSGGVFTVKGAGNDVWLTSDQFNFNYWTMTGDGIATVRVTSLTNASFYTKAGIMMRETLNPGSAYAYALTIPSLNAFQFRTGTGNYADTSAYFPTTSPIWVRLVRVGANLTSYSSPDGSTWTQTGNTVTVNMASTLFVGLAVTSQNPGQLATAVFDNLSFTPGSTPSPDFTISSAPSVQSANAGQNASYGLTIAAVNGFSGTFTFSAGGLPVGTTAIFNPPSVSSSGTTTLTLQTSTTTPSGLSLPTILAQAGALARATGIALNLATGAPLPLSDNGSDADIGGPAIPGSWTVASGVHSVSSSGTDIWKSSDQFNFNYWAMTGDGTATARITSLANTAFYAKAGIMMRETLNPGSAYAFAMTVPSMNAFQFRASTGNYATSSGYTPTTFPMWVRLVRAGANLTSYASPDGATWTQTGLTVTINMASTIYVGLAVTSHNSGQLTTAVFDNLSFTPGGSPAPDFTIVAAPPTQAINAGQNAAFGLTIAAANAFSGTVTFSAAGLPAGTTATFSPASLNSSGTTTVTLQTSTTSPGGTIYSPVILAQGGGLTRETAITLNLAVAPSSLYGNGTDADIGSPTTPGSWIVNNGVHTVSGSGTDIWNSSDQFNFNYWQITGDCTITARIVSLTNTNFYAKAGVMIRESLNPNSTFAISVTTPSLFNFHYRTTTGGTASSGPYFNVLFPQWVRLVRSNGVFTGYSSPDGVTWSQINSPVPITMTQGLYYVGLAVTSHAPTLLNTAVFDHISITQP